MKRIQTDYCILYGKYDIGKVELVISIHVDGVFMAGMTDKLENIKEMIKLKFNIQESVKVRNFLGAYYKWGHNAKGVYAKVTMEKNIKKLVDGYKKFTGVDVKVQKTPGTPGTSLCNSELEYPTYIDKYRSFVVQIMWYTRKVGTDVDNS